jgi:hypothetical protein
MADYTGANSQGNGATPGGTGTLNGLFKERYADKMQRLIPDGKKMIKMVAFVPKERQPGNNYHQPVVLGMEHGITFADDSEGAFALAPPVAGQIKDAVVRGYQLLLRSVMPYGAASRALGPGERAFEDATKFLVGNMLDSISKKLEIELMYGQAGYGVVASVAGLVITLSAPEFASGIWSGSENMPIDIYDATLTTLRVSTTVTAVDLTARTITVGAVTGVVATDIVNHKGATGKEFAGLHKILTNTGSLFGISAASYALWKGSAFAPSTTSVLSFAIVQQAISKGVEKGLDSDVTVLVNPGHWDDLLTEQAALRMFDSSYKPDQAENGSRSIKFHSQNGLVEIVPSIYCKEGYAYIMAVEDWVRIGSTDITFKRPAAEGNFFRELEDHAGYELRAYTDQALFCARPGRSVIISNLKTS